MTKGRNCLMEKDLKGLFLRKFFSHRTSACVSADRLGPVIRQDCALSNENVQFWSCSMFFLYQELEKSHFLMMSCGI